MTSNKELLAEWNYSMEKWNEYVDIEKGNKKEDSIYFGIGILILGTLGLMFLRGTSFWTGLLFAAPLAFLIPFLRMKLAYTHLKKGVKNPTVKIYHDEVLVNGKRIELVNSRKRIKSVKILEEQNGINLLEIDIQWLTAKGPTNDEYRFLIPKGELENAAKLISRL